MRRLQTGGAQKRPGEAVRRARGRGCWWAAVTLSACLAFSPAEGTAMQTDSTTAVEAEPAAETAATAPADVQLPASDPLPAPSYQRAYSHLFIAFGVAWGLLLGYVVLLDRRISQARRELERMGAE